MRKSVWGGIAAVVGAGLVGGDAAGQDPTDPGTCWCELTDGGGDAGSLPGTAQATMGPPQPLLCIEGETTMMNPGGPDREDMYRIRICDPEAFLATTEAPGFASFDSMLWVFRGMPPALGVVANDNISGQSTNARVTSFPTDGSDPLTEPGVYNLAISGFFDRPRNAQGAVIFDLGPPPRTEISGPDGPGGADPIGGWTKGGGEGGTYRIRLRGVTYAGVPLVDCNGNGAVDACDIVSMCSFDLNSDGVPDECQCAGELDGSGARDFGDILVILGGWGPCPPGGCCPGDANFDGSVDFADILLVLAGWGPC